MTVAEAEFADWDTNGLDEQSGNGLEKVRQYLASVGYNTNSYAHWCGGFVGYCLQNCAPSQRDTLVTGGAKASNWINWGNVSLRNRDLNEIPRGAVVVTRSMAPGTSGHVAFFEGASDLMEVDAGAVEDV